MQIHFLVPISVILHTLSYRTLQKRSILKGMMIIRRWQIKCRTIWLSEGVTAAGHFIPLKNAINGEISQSGSKNNVADIIELLTTVSNTWNCTKRTKMFTIQIILAQSLIAFCVTVKKSIIWNRMGVTSLSQRNYPSVDMS